MNEHSPGKLTDMNSGDRPVFVHVGYPKAGSTSLQNRLFFPAKAFDYLSYRKPQGAGNAIQNSLELREFYQRLSGEASGYIDGDFCQRWQRLRGSIDGQKAIVLSDESLSLGRVPAAEVARRIDTVVPGARILVVIRNQCELLRSWFDMLTVDPEFARNHSFSSWLRSSSGGPKPELLRNLEYARVLSMYLDRFGADRVAVFLFERLFRSSDDVERLADFLRIDRGAVLSALGGTGENTVKQTAVLRAARRLLGPFHLSAVLPHHVIKRCVGILGSIYPSGPTRVSESDRVFVSGRFSDDTERLCELLNLDVRQYGY
jgi:hypothetical protein